MSVAGVVCVCLLLFLAFCCPFLCRRWKLREYAGIDLPFSARVASEDDQYTFCFVDGTYTIVYHADPEHVRHLLTQRPEWASADWAPGRNTNLAKRLSTPTRPSLFSVTSKTEIDPIRILTVDTVTSTVYFELLDM